MRIKLLFYIVKAKRNVFKIHLYVCIVRAYYYQGRHKRMVNNFVRVKLLNMHKEFQL